MTTQELLQYVTTEEFKAKLLDIYVDAERMDYQVQRYQKAIEIFQGTFGAGEASIYSAPGRTEVGGNHTDHQYGRVLAASINLDAIGIVRKRDDGKVQIKSDGYDLITVDSNDIQKVDEEENTTLS